MMAIVIVMKMRMRIVVMVMVVVVVLVVANRTQKEDVKKKYQNAAVHIPPVFVAVV